MNNLRDLHRPYKQQVLVILLSALNGELWVDTERAIGDMFRSSVYTENYVSINFNAIRIDLMSALNDGEPRVISMINYLMTEGHHSKYAIDLLISMIQDDHVDGGLKEALIWILAILGEDMPEALPQFIELMLSISDWHKCYGAPQKVIVKWCEEHPQIVLKHIFDEGVQTRLLPIVSLLAKAGIAGAVSLLLNCAEHNDTSVREKALWAIGNSETNSQDVINYLMNLLSSNDESLRSVAHRVLWKLNKRQPDTVNYLTKQFIETPFSVNDDDDFILQLFDAGVTQPEVVEHLAEDCILSWDTPSRIERTIELFPRLWKIDKSTTERILFSFISGRDKYGTYAAEIVGYFGLYTEQIFEALLVASAKLDEYNESYIWALGKIAQRPIDFSLIDQFVSFLIETQLIPVTEEENDQQSSLRKSDQRNRAIKYMPRLPRTFRCWLTCLIRNRKQIPPLDLSLFSSASDRSDNFDSFGKLVSKLKSQEIILALGYAGQKSHQLHDILHKALFSKDDVISQSASVALAMHDECSLQIIKHLINFERKELESLPPAIIRQDLWNQGKNGLNRLIQLFPEKVLNNLFVLLKAGHLLAADVIINHFHDKVKPKTTYVVVSELHRQLCYCEPNNLLYETVDRVVAQITRNQVTQLSFELGELDYVSSSTKK